MFRIQLTLPSCFLRRSSRDLTLCQFISSINKSWWIFNMRNHRLIDATSVPTPNSIKRDQTGNVVPLFPSFLFHFRPLFILHKNHRFFRFSFLCFLSFPSLRCHQLDSFSHFHKNSWKFTKIPLPYRLCLFFITRISFYSYRNYFIRLLSNPFIRVARQWPLKFQLIQSLQ